MHRSRTLWGKAKAAGQTASGSEVLWTASPPQAPLTRVVEAADRRAALTAMRSEDAYVARYRSAPRSSSSWGSQSIRSLPVRSATKPVTTPMATSTPARFVNPSLMDSTPKLLSSGSRDASSLRASSSRAAMSETPAPAQQRREPENAEDTARDGQDGSSWAFGGGVNSQGGPAMAQRRASHVNKVEFVVEGTAGKGAISNYGRRKRYTHETDGRAGDEQGNYASGSKDSTIAQQYRHEYAPTARSPRPLPHHTYFSTPSSSFNDDAAATAAGVGPVGVGGPRSGLGSGAGMHVLESGGSIKRKRSALILPGQGSQYVGMTDDIFRKYRAARQVWTVAEEALAYGPHLPRQILSLIENDVPAEQRERFEEELGKSVQWDQSASRFNTGSNVARGRRGWLRDLVFSGDQLNLTRAENAQPSTLTSSLSILSVLRHEFPVDLIANHIDFVAGHGTGIYAALCSAGALDLRDAVRLLRHRGLATARFLANDPVLFPEGSPRPESIYETWAFANAGSGKGAELINRTTIGSDAIDADRSISAPSSIDGSAPLASIPRMWKRTQMSGCMIRPGKLQESLAAIRQVSEDIRAGKVEHVMPDEVVEVANINSSLQIVLSGTRVGVSLASDRLRQLNLGNRAVNLPVSGPYHSSLMRAGAEFLQPTVDAMPLHDIDPNGLGKGHSGPLQLVSSHEGAPILHTKDEVRANLHLALSKPVMWLQSIERMLEQGVQRFICLGPGRACAHLLSKELAYRDRLRMAKGEAPGDYEVWSINSVEDVEQIGAVLSRLSAEEGATRQQPDADRFVAL